MLQAAIAVAVFALLWIFERVAAIDRFLRTGEYALIAGEALPVDPRVDLVECLDIHRAATAERNSWKGNPRPVRAVRPRGTESNA